MAVPFVTKRRQQMDFGLVFLGFVGVVLVSAFLHVLSKMASEREAAARRKRDSIRPFSGDTITYAGHS
jgi:hypothetical protein